MVHSLFELLGRVFFSRTRIRDLDFRLNTAGLDMPAESFAGFLSLAILLVSIAVAALLIGNSVVYTAVYQVLGQAELSILVLYVISLLISYFVTMLILSSFLIVKSDARRNALELALPDFLLLVSSNVKAGMPLDQAMWYAAKPEFGLLSKEVKNIIKRSFSGESLEDSLNTLSMRFDSKTFTRTITLIKQASATGGEVAAVLESTASDVRNTNIMKKEVAASLVLYEIFVLFAGMIGTPFLFSVAGKLVKVFEFRSFGIPTTPTSSIFGSGSGFSISEPVITAQEFFYFSLAIIFVTALFSSFIVGVIRKGSKNEGVKYFPLVLFIAYIIFFVTDSLLNNFFSTFSR